MSKQERTFHIYAHPLIAATFMLLVIMFVSGCGGGNSSSTANPSTSSPPVAAGSLILQANVGGVCETLLAGETYTTTVPSLSCNNGTDPYTAYLDGSKSTSSSNLPLSYAWSLVTKPAGSNVTLTGATTARPTFVPDKAGAYSVQLVVSALGVSSPRAVAMVVVIDNATLTTTYKFHGGLSSNCSSCHTESFPTLKAKPSTHITTSNMCQACHSPLGFAIASPVDHAEVFGKCSDCHNGSIATGKSSTHIVTTQECSDCHNTTSFLTLNGNGTYDHSNITQPCSACHNGTTAIGTASDPNPTGHPSISVECNSCHNTTTFKAPFPNHSDTSVVVPGTCGSAGCHDGSSIANGVPIPGKNSAPYPHPSTGTGLTAITTACDLCHNTTSFNMGGLFDHGVLARHPITCASCHDGLNATGKISGHIATAPASDCSNCHNTSTFIGGFVDHTGPSVTGAQCTDCHDGAHTWDFIDSKGATITLDIPGTPTAPPTLVNIHTAAAGQSCGDCHTAGGSFALATVDHSSFGTLAVPNTSIDCISCHDDTIATGKPVGHLSTTEQCYACHEPQSDTFANGVFNHSTVSISGLTSTPTCTSCHDGSTSAISQSLTHVPTTGQDCLICHGTGYASFAVATFDHTAAGITNNCASCHDGKSHDGTIVITKPSSHIPTSSDCSTCHTATNNGPGINGTAASGFASATTFVNTIHPAYTTGCRTCHNGSYVNAPYLAKSHPINSVHDTVDANGWECNACHTTTGNFLETNPVNHQDPAIKAQACVSCHVAGNTVEPIGKSGAHPATSDTCQNCHQAGGSFTAGFDHATLKTGQINHALESSCVTCHDGVNATGKIANHLPTTRNCLTCHTGYPPIATSFVGGTFDHAGPEMTGRLCMDCHDNTIAIGKSATHQVTNSDCVACHTTVGTFASNATGFDHTGKTSGCAASSCHTSGNPNVTDVTDDPNPKPHIPILNGSTEVDCYNCHKNPGGTFANAAMEHTVVSFEACQSCHDGNHDGNNAAHIVTPKSATHFVTSVTACASCHTSTTNWSSTSYTHTGSGYPGNHSTRKVTKCTQCHKDTPANADISIFPLSPYGSTCAACHASKGINEHGSGGTLPSKYYNCGNSGCHQVSSSSF